MHSRFFRGLRLHLVCTLSGLPVLFAIVGAKADERQVLLGMMDTGRDVVAAHPGQTLLGDKNYFGAAFGQELTGLRVSDALRLPFDCVTANDAGAPYLRYFNHKMKREALVPLDDESPPTG